MDLKKRFSEEQIIGFLQQAEAGVAIAAPQGDTEAMGEPIEGYDRLNL